MIHAQLDDSFICVGYGNLTDIETDQTLVYLPDGWDEDLKWRKYENGIWSTEKFEPIQPSAEELKQQRIAQLQAELTALQN